MSWDSWAQEIAAEVVGWALVMAAVYLVMRRR
jgi:hypothetical protein